MKNLLLCFVLCIIGFIPFHCYAQSWYPIGNPNFTDSVAANPAFALDSAGTPYVAYSDWAHGERATVMKFNGVNWEDVGIAGFSDVSISEISLVIDGNGIPYVAYYNAFSDSIAVMQYNGLSWVSVGTGFGIDPYYFSGGLNMAIDRYNNLYLSVSACPIPDLGCQTNLTKYSGGSWHPIGSFYVDTMLSFNSSPLVIDSNCNAYQVTYTSYQTIGVIKYDSATPGVGVLVGGKLYLTDDRGRSIAIDKRGALYFAYNFPSVVAEYSDSAWTLVGSGGGSYPSVAIDKYGSVYFASVNGTFNGVVNINRFNGSSWDSLGSVGINAHNSTIAVDTTGMPFVAYADDSFGGKLTVKYYGFPTSVKNTSANTSSLTLFPNPTHNTFTLHITTPTNEPATITITNILGERVKQLTAPTNQNTEIQLDAAPGIYFITAITKEGSMSGKIMVE